VTDPVRICQGPKDAGERADLFVRLVAQLLGDVTPPARAVTVRHASGRFRGLRIFSIE
jgi:hypothetical protein